MRVCEGLLSALKCYRVYLSVQAHFKRDKYNAFRYKFKVNASADAFNNRRDRQCFVRLANTFTREEDLIDYLVANMVADKTFVGEMDKATYTEWQKRMTQRFYQFKLDMKKLVCYVPEHGFDAVFISDNGQYPIMIKKLLAGEVSLETVVLFHKLTGAVNQMPDFDPLIWPDLRRKLVKYAPFISMDKNKYKAAFMDIMQDVISTEETD